MAQSHTGRKVAAGVGLAALAAAAAGAVFLYGTDAGKKRRKDIKSWSLRMRADVMDKMEKMKDWSEEAYHEAVSAVEKKYKQMKNIDTGELAALVASLRSHWKNIKREVEGTQKSRPRRKAARSTKTKAKNGNNTK
jgi:hypothetical protein